MLGSYPLLWLLAVMWAVAAAAFLSRLDTRKLAVVVIVLSLLVLVTMIRGRGHPQSARPVLVPMSAPPVVGPI